MSVCYRLRRSVCVCFLLLGLFSTAARAEVITYHYDEADRLIRTSFDGDGSVHNVFDPLGNRLVKTVRTSLVSNEPPAIPSQPSPADGALNIDPEGILAWTGGDPDLDNILYYTLSLAEESQPLIIKSGLKQGQFQPETLNSYTTYNWSITATDNFNGQTQGPIWSFTTGNTPPLPPEDMAPADGAEIYSPESGLSWTCGGDPNPNDTVVYDVYFGTVSEPPLVSEGQTTPGYNLPQTNLTGQYFWKVVVRDNNGAATSSSVMSLHFLDSDRDGLSDYTEDSWCTDPENYDSDDDSIPDGMEDTNLNGILDPGETNPCTNDTDNDGMSDAWEIFYGFDPLADDAGLDTDEDGQSNLEEYLQGTDPTMPENGQASNTVEGFESGDFRTFYWSTPGKTPWSVTPGQPFNGTFSADSPALQDGEVALLETWLPCDAGEIRFFHAQRTVANEGWLRFYIDGQLQGEWSGELPYQQSSYSVEAGNHHFKWEYTRGTGIGDTIEKIHLDDITFPGIPDSDEDGVMDGWELHHFGTLDQSLCTDSDGDGLSDLEEARWYSSPHALDTDNDGIPDYEEVLFGLDPARYDVLLDADGDGETNISEYLGGTNPGDGTDFSHGATENFESGDMKRFSWVLSGAGVWTATSVNPHGGVFAAQPINISGNEWAAMETTVNCTDGVIAFHYNLATVDGTLSFYIDDILQENWTENTGYTQAIFPVAAGLHSFKWIYAVPGEVIENGDAVWLDDIVFPGVEDSDNDGVTDNWEFCYFSSLDGDLCGDSDGDGLSDLEEAAAGSDPFSLDTDGDGMDDAWEVANGLDPLVDDSLEDADSDGATNFSEYMEDTDPQNPNEGGLSTFEGFESGDFSKFYWISSGDNDWRPTTVNPQEGVYAAQVPLLGDNQSASLETTIYCQAGSIQFFVATSSQAAGDKLEFRVNGVLKGEWSGNTPYQQVSFPVSAGKHTFQWTFTKDGALSELEDSAWLDSISFPGLADSDQDGVSDGWEFQHFGTLDYSLCGDSDGDGLSDLEEAAAGTDPFAVDSDGDGMDDAWEVANNLDPLTNDSLEDADGDGSTNFSEYINDNDPNTPDAETSASFEGFESGDLTKFHWSTTGDGLWQVTSDNPQAGAFSAQAPTLADTMSATLATSLYSFGGPISFSIATSSEANDKLEFWINGALAGEWSGDTPHQQVSFAVAEGWTTFQWTFTKDGALSELEDSAWLDSISFPGLADSDQDGVSDGWEFQHFGTLDYSLCGDSDGDGLSDLEEAAAGTDPFAVDSDGDGMDDAWEVANNLDPLTNDSLEDADGDGSTNFSEYINDNDPNTPDAETSASFEGFESGDLTKFHWSTTGDGLWQVTSDNPQAGAFSAQAPTLADTMSATLATSLYSFGGPISFSIATSSEANDKLEFWINGALAGEWSGDTPHQQVSFAVAEGWTTFQWTFTKDGALSGLEDSAWLDSISFPGLADSDQDGVIDGWEFQHFNTLDYGLCGDSDNDGLRDIEEVMAGTDPLNPDSDGNGIDDGVEVPSIFPPPASLPGDEEATAEQPGFIIWETGENIALTCWDIFDDDPPGAIIDIRFDDVRLSEVVEFYGSGLDNGYRLQDEDGTWWDDNLHTILQWDIKSNEPFEIQAVVQTANGLKYLLYKPVDEDLLGTDSIIEHGLGVHVQDNTWWTLVRDLQYDLKEAQPDNEFQSILGFLVRGNCQVDDIITRAELPTDHDSDGDGLTDAQEINTISTHPYYVDSDGDGIEDGEEYTFWGDAWNADPDGDGLINILDSDSDNDGSLDGTEKDAGTDAADSSSYP